MQFAGVNLLNNESEQISGFGGREKCRTGVGRGSRGEAGGPAGVRCNEKFQRQPDIPANSLCREWKGEILAGSDRDTKHQTKKPMMISILRLCLMPSLDCSWGIIIGGWKRGDQPNMDVGP